MSIFLNSLAKVNFLLDWECYFANSTQAKNQYTQISLNCCNILFLSFFFFTTEDICLIMLVSGYSIMISYFYRYTPFKVIIKYHLYLVLYIALLYLIYYIFIVSFLHLIYYKPSSSYLLIPFPFLAPFSNFSTTGNYKFVLCIYESVSVLLYLFL